MDLFVQHLSKKEQLHREIRRREYMTTHEVLDWGLKNFCNRARTAAQELAQEGKIRRLTDKEKAFRGFKDREGVYTPVNKGENKTYEI